MGGTTEQLEAAYRKALLHNLLLGWWGIPFGLIWTPVALAANAKALRQVRAGAPPDRGPPGGWSSSCSHKRCF